MGVTLLYSHRHLISLEIVLLAAEKKYILRGGLRGGKLEEQIHTYNYILKYCILITGGMVWQCNTLMYLTLYM